MSDVQGPFALNQDEVVAKVIDGEVIVIRLTDGTYYTMDRVGTRIWELVESHHDLRSIIDTIGAWYDAPAERVASDVNRVVDDLLQERLIVVSDGAVRRMKDDGAPPQPGLPYETPQLNIYRDMGNLLALDPPTPGIDDIALDRPKNR